MRPILLMVVALLSVSACDYQDRAKIVRGSDAARMRVAATNANGTANSVSQEQSTTGFASVEQASLRVSRADPLLVRGDTLRRGRVEQMPMRDLQRHVADVQNVFSAPAPQPRPNDLALSTSFQSANASMDADLLVGPRMSQFMEARRSALLEIDAPPIIDIAEIRLALRGPLD